MNAALPPLHFVPHRRTSASPNYQSRSTDRLSLQWCRASCHRVCTRTLLLQVGLSGDWVDEVMAVSFKNSAAPLALRAIVRTEVIYLPGAAGFEWITAGALGVS